MILINREKLQKTLQDFYNITNTRIAVLDNYYREISAYPLDLCDFCKNARENPDILEKCMHCDEQAFEYAKRERKQYTYRCHLGLYESVFPIITEKNLVGYLMIGQFIEESDRAKIERDFILKYGKMSNLTQYLNDVPAFNKKLVDSIASIMSVCAEYLCFSKTISQKKVGICARIDAFIENNLSVPISVQDIATEFGISKTSVYLILKQGAGMSVTEYVNYKKIEQAKQLIAQGFSTNQILEKVAFSDANYFSRIFRQYTGYTIRAYKKELAFQEEKPV